MPRKDRTLRLEDCRKRWTRRVKQGLCLDCDAPHLPKRRRCAEHLRVLVNKVVARQKERRDVGLCIQCGVNPLETLNHCHDCRVTTNGHKSASRQRAINAVLDHYGRECACCGEAMPEFLTIDHKGNDGKQHREYGDVYRILYRDFQRTGKWKEDCETSCYNCNSGRWRNGGICPHQEQSCKKVA